MDTDIQKKLIWFSRIIFLFFIVATIRVFYIQIINADKLEEEIIDERVREQEIKPERGKILDRNGNTLAMSILMHDVAVNPNLIVSEKHQEKVAKVLSENIPGLDYNEILKIVQDNKTKYKVVAKQVDFEAVQKIQESGISGIQITPSPKRVYPNGEAGGTFLGFVNDISEPMAGIEVAANEFLAGKSGYSVAEVTPIGEKIPVGSQNLVSPVTGQNVQLTIDLYMQHIVEERLAKAAEPVEKGGLEPEAIHAVLMNPQNGEILAMASYPSFDPNEYKKSDPKTWTNTPANFVYEPGSIFKPIIMNIAFENKVIDENDRFPSGVTYVKGTRIRDWNQGRGWGAITPKQIIQHSSNVGMVFISKRLTNEQLVEGINRFGFGKKTGIELPGEQTGFNHPNEKSLEQDPVRRANISFGQGIMVTPIQMITAYSEIVNGGYEVKPTLIKKVTDNFGNVIYENETSERKRIWSEYSTNKVREFLKYNLEAGSGTTAKIEGYDGGGKTGSAWYVENGKYAGNRIIGSFIGYLPHKNPQFILLISVKNPKGAEFGSQAANPIFHDIMTEIVRYVGLKPTEKSDEAQETKEKPVSFNVPDVKMLLFEDAKAKLEEHLGNKVKIEKDGTGEVVVNQTFTYGNHTLNIVLETRPIKDGKSYNIPSFIGKTEEEVRHILDKYHISAYFYGKHTIVEQSILPGQHYNIRHLHFWLK